MKNVICNKADTCLHSVKMGGCACATPHEGCPIPTCLIDPEARCITIEDVIIDKVKSLQNTDLNRNSHYGKTSSEMIEEKKIKPLVKEPVDLSKQAKFEVGRSYNAVKISWIKNETIVVKCFDRNNNTIGFSNDHRELYSGVESDKSKNTECATFGNYYVEAINVTTPKVSSIKIEDQIENIKKGLQNIGDKDHFNIKKWHHFYETVYGKSSIDDVSFNNLKAVHSKIIRGFQIDRAIKFTFEPLIKSKVETIDFLDQEHNINFAFFGISKCKIKDFVKQGYKVFYGYIYGSRFVDDRTNDNLNRVYTELKKGTSLKTTLNSVFKPIKEEALKPRQSVPQIYREETGCFPIIPGPAPDSGNYTPQYVHWLENKVKNIQPEQPTKVNSVLRDYQQKGLDNAFKEPEEEIKVVRTIKEQILDEVKTITSLMQRNTELLH